MLINSIISSASIYTVVLKLDHTHVFTAPVVTYMYTYSNWMYAFHTWYLLRTYKRLREGSTFQQLTYDYEMISYTRLTFRDFI